MNRDEHIKEAAEKLFGNDPTMTKNLVVGAFIEGAKWADEHPKQIEISIEDIEKVSREVIPENWQERQDRLWNMIERNLRAQFIRKACEWLEKNVADIWNNPCNPDKIVEDFRKAMKGD